MGYGVLEALRDTPIHWEGRDTTMLDELDFISSVSGGSLLAGYYVAYREQTFERFEREVLAYDLQAALWQRGLSPRGLWQQTSSRYGRADFLAELLDEKVFHGKRYGDLPHRRPLAYINATDMADGGRFEFTQDQFDYLCSDLNRFPLGRAVAASMAVPVLLSPISLWNYATACPVPTAQLAFQGMAGRGEFVHLLDGGLADNSGVQTPLEIINSRGGIAQAARISRLRGIRHRVFIIVNAQTPPTDDPSTHSADTPGVLRQFRTVVDVPIDRHSAASIELLKGDLMRWQPALRSSGQDHDVSVVSKDADFSVIEVSLAAPPAGLDAKSLTGIPTSLSISAEQSHALQQFAREALARSPEWQRLLATLRSGQ